MKSLLLFFLAFLTIPLVELEKRSLLNDKIELLVPANFTIMSEEILDLKYPKGHNRPSFVLTNEETTVNIAMNHIANPANQSVIESYTNSIKASFQKSFPNATWKGDGIHIINGRKVGYLQLITDGTDQKIYNYLFITDVDKKLLICTFNCTEQLLPEWEETADKIVKSLKLK